MNSVTRWKDILALNGWVNVRSKLGWISSILISAAITAEMIVRKLQATGGSVAKTVALCFVLFVAFMAAIWLLALAFVFLVASANLLRKGAIGPKRFTISDQAFTEEDGWKITSVAWAHIRSIDKTRRHIFIRIGRWKYLILSARDFPSEYEFAQYYADLLKAKHQNITSQSCPTRAP